MTYQVPKTDVEAFTLALKLAVSAPTDKQSSEALKMANQLATQLTAAQIETVKANLEVEQADD